MPAFCRLIFGVPIRDVRGGAPGKKVHRRQATDVGTPAAQFHGRDGLRGSVQLTEVATTRALITGSAARPSGNGPGSPR